MLVIYILYILYNIFTSYDTMLPIGESIHFIETILTGL